MDKLPEKIVEYLISGEQSYYRLTSSCTDYSRYTSMRIFHGLREKNRNVVMTAVTDRGLHVTQSQCSIFDHLHLIGDEKRSYERLMKTVRSAYLSDSDALRRILESEYIIVHELEMIDRSQLEYIVYYLRVISAMYASVQSSIRRSIMWSVTIEECQSEILNIFLEHYISYISDRRYIDNIVRFFGSLEQNEYDEKLADRIADHMRLYSDKIPRSRFKERLGFELTHIAIKSILKDMSTLHYDDLSDEWYSRDIMAATKHEGGHRTIGYMKLIVFHDPYTSNSRLLPNQLKVNNVDFKVIALPTSSRLDDRLLSDLSVARLSDELRSYLSSCRVQDYSGLECSHIQLVERFEDASEINQRYLDQLLQLSPTEYHAYDGKLKICEESGLPTIEECQISDEVDSMFSSRWSPRTISVKNHMRVFITDTSMFKTIEGSDINVMIGQLGTVIEYGLEYMNVQLDSGEIIIVTPRMIFIRSYNVDYVRYQMPISIGYAISFEDARMMKFDRTLVHPHGMNKPGLAYHALTRFREDLRIVGDLNCNDIIPFN